MHTAAEVIRHARGRAGLTQRALGLRAGLPQSAVSAYERGHKQPTVPVLARLVLAAGLELRLMLAEGSTPDAAPFAGPVGRRVQRRRAALRDLLAVEGYTRPQVFGSVARGDDRPDSDLDLLVDLPAGVGLIALAGMQRRATALIGVDVDLVPRDGLRDRVAADVAADLVPL